MLRNTFDLSKPHTFVCYGRMSSDTQNERSPEQQFDSIKQVMRRQGVPWIHIDDYRDDAKSGRFMKNRPGFNDMLRDIRTGVIEPDLILVDTLERFGRSDSVTSLRHELYTQYGVLVLTADSGFANPLTVSGRALTAVEGIRVTEDGRVKAQNVLRGKKDLITHKKAWPGGPPPFGFKLQSVMTAGANGKTEVDYSLLVHDPESDWIAERIFSKAAETGWGAVRLARFINADPSVPEKFKPISDSNIGNMFNNTLYRGELRWNTNSTGIVNETRVLQANPEEEWVRIPDFCEAIVSPELWQSIQVLRQKRRRQIEEGRHGAPANGKLIVPGAPGLTLKYLLTGLVRCGHCGASMRPSPSKHTNKKTGEVWRRTYYVCPRYIIRVCPNEQYLPEDALRDAVISRIRARLYPRSAGMEQVPEWFPALMEQVEQEIRRQA